MRVKEIIKFLVEADDYFLARLTVDDSTVEMIRDHMGSHYDLLKEKEEQYQNFITRFNRIGIEAERAGESLRKMLRELDKMHKDGET